MSVKDPLKELIERRHPLYEALEAHWNFLEETYEGGREWFCKGNIFRFHKEGDKEYEDRVARAYRFNHTKQVVDLVDKYIFKMAVARKDTDAPDSVQNFWKKATLSGLDINTYARRLSSATSKFGRVWIVVDSTATEGGTVSVADEADTRIYSYYVRPQDALDMSYDDLGELNWILIREFRRDDSDPLDSTGQFIPQYRLWDKQGWKLFEEKKAKGGKTKVELVEVGEHFLGVVPVFPSDHNFSEEKYETQGLIDDVAYLDRANANYLSNLDAIIQDQTFSVLTMPAQGLLPGEDGYDKVVELGTKRVVIYNGEAGAKPEFISPDSKQAELIITAIGKIINEIYHSVGLAGERTKDDNGGGIDNASGVAKAYDFDKINTLLASKATALELTEKKIAYLVALWAGQEEKINLDEQLDLIAYPKDFDVRGLYDEFEIAARLSLLSAPDAIRQEQMKAIVEKLFPAADEALKQKLEATLTSWTPTKDAADALAAGGTADQALSAQGTQKTAKELVR